MATAFGPGSAIFGMTTERLSRIYALANRTPPVAARFREWQRFWVNVHGQDPPQTSSRTGSNETLFIHQTYVALLSRLVARRFVAPRRAISGAEELLEIINCDYFSRRGIGNFGEGDLFSWLSLEPRWELGLEDQVLEIVQGLAEALAPTTSPRHARAFWTGLPTGLRRIQPNHGRAGWRNTSSKRNWGWQMTQTCRCWTPHAAPEHSCPLPLGPSPGQ